MRDNGEILDYTCSSMVLRFTNLLVRIEYLEHYSLDEDRLVLLCKAEPTLVHESFIYQQD